MTRKHTKRRRLSCGDREDACELLSQGRTANALAEKYLLELLGRCSSHSDACNRQVGEPVESNRSQGRTANALAEKYLLELLGRCSSHSDACNRQVGEPVESNRFACAATPLPRACTRVLVRSRCSFWVRQSWCCCLAVRSGCYGKRPSSSV